MSFYIIGVAFMFILYVLVGIVVGRKVKTVDDYYVAGRNAPTILIVGSLLASYMSTVAFMGEIGFTYSGFVIPFLIQNIITGVGYLLGAMLFGRFIRRTNVLTIPEFFGIRFQSTRLRILASCVTVVGLIAYLVAVTQGTALLLGEMIDTPYIVNLIIVCLVYLSFCIYSGAGGVLITDTMMFLLFTFAAFVSVPFIAKAAGGWPEALINSVLIPEKPGIFDWTGVITGDYIAYGPSATDTVVYIIMYGIIWCGVLAVSPWQASRYLMAKNEHVVMRSGFIAAILLTLSLTAIHFATTATNAIVWNYEPAGNIFIHVVMEYCPLALGIIVCGGILSAGISSASTFVTLIANSLSSDILPYFIKDKKGALISTHDGMVRSASVTNSRLVMLIIGAIVVVITYFQPPSVLWIGYFAATWFAVSWTFTGVGSIWAKKMTEKGAFFAMLFGAIGLPVMKALETWFGVGFPSVFPPEVAGFACSLAGYFIFNRLGTRTEFETAYLKQLKVTPANAFDPVLIKQTKRYPIIAIILGVITSIALYFLYYVPWLEAQEILMSR